MEPDLKYLGPEHTVNPDWLQSSAGKHSRYLCSDVPCLYPGRTAGRHPLLACIGEIQPVNQLMKGALHGTANNVIT